MPPGTVQRPLAPLDGIQVRHHRVLGPPGAWTVAHPHARCGRALQGATYVSGLVQPASTSAAVWSPPDAG